MTIQLPSSGSLKMSDIKRNLEITSAANLSLGSPLLRALANKKTGSIKLSDFYSANELESLILAAQDNNNNATGYYQSFWGENDRPQFGTQNLVGVYDDHPGNKFVFAVSGNQPTTTFRALVINNVIYYQSDATTYEYIPGSNTTVWTWVGLKAGLVAGVVYELSYLIGPGTAAQPQQPAGTYPVGQGIDWTLSFEDTFPSATLDTTKWNLGLWYETPGATNYDISAGRLRIWPLLSGATWVRRNLTTFGKFSQVEGYWEVKCKVPVNKGIRCTVWLFNHDTTARPMISLMSALCGHTLASGWVNASNQSIDFSFGVTPTTDGQWLLFNRYKDLLPARAAINLSTGDHVFGVKKTATKLHWFLDGVELNSVELLGPNTMTLPMYMVITMDFNTDGPAADGTTVQNATGAFEIDYVRAWKPTTGTGSGTDTTTTLPTGYVAPVGRPSSLYPYMTFREEFNGTLLDSAKWNDHIWYAANNGKNNIKVENSTLYMWPALPFASGTTDLNATIDTDGKFYQKFGYFECRAKLPIGRGCWPAFWLYNHDLSSVRPEIDVMEAYSGGDASTGQDWGSAALHPQRYAATVWGEVIDGSPLGTRNSANTFGYIDLSASWNVYAVDWKRGYMAFYLNGTMLGQPITYADTEMDMRMYILLDLWLGSVSGQANTNETPTGQSNSFMVDYVRAWAHADGSTVVEGTLPPLLESEGGKGTGTTVPVAKPIVAFIGNSTTWGYKSIVGGQVAVPYPLAFAQRQTGYDVRNHGINSTHTTHWINGTNGVPQTWAAFMAANANFKYVCMDFGSLDQFDLTVTAFKNNLKTMIAEVRNVSGRIPVLITPYVNDFSGTAVYAGAVRDVGAETGTAVIDKFTWSQNVVTNNGGDVRAFMPDGIHPTEQFYIDGGNYISSQWATVTGGVVQPPDSTRDPLQQPFASTSIWNYPIGSGAQYVAANLLTTWSEVTYGADGTYAPMPHADEEYLVLRPSAPSRQVGYSSVGWDAGDRCVVTGATLFNAPIPDNYIVPDSNGNNPAAILMADGRTIKQCQPFTRCAPTGPATAMVVFDDEDIYGQGITGAHGGSGLSSLGGTLRLGELRPAQGNIGPKHVLKCNVHARTALFNATTFDQAYRWPATTCDGYAREVYGVDNNNTNFAMRMGALLAIPANVDINSLGLETQPAKQLAWTLQNYGTYIVDDTSSPGFMWAVEVSPDGDFRTQFRDDWGYAFEQRNIDDTPWVRDTRRLVAQLYVVDNNSPTSIGGGGTPRQPLLPEFGSTPPVITPPQTANTLQARYVRDWTGGSTANSGSHWVEIRVLNESDVNVALGKTVTFSGALSTGTAGLVVDGNTDSSLYAEVTASTPAYATVDLGQVYNVKSVTVWHYYTDGRTYFGTNTQLSTDGVTWINLFDSSVNGTYTETAGGRTSLASQYVPPSQTSDPVPAVPSNHPYTYTLTLNEEFNGSSLNFNVWNDHIWWNEAGEKTGKPVNWEVSNGSLHIWPADGFYPRTIDTDGKFYQTYGFYECESKLPIGRGCWPAFWLYNHDDPNWRPEIDIMEAYSGGGSAGWWSTDDLHPNNYGATCHRNDGNKVGDMKLRDFEPWMSTPVDLSAGYHKYGALVEPDGVTFFFDGVQLGKISTTFFSMRLYILLDLYFGSASGTPNNAETPKGIANAFSTRYVRAWRKN